MSQATMILSYTASGGGWQVNAALPVSGWAVQTNASQITLEVLASPVSGEWLIAMHNNTGDEVTGTVSLLLAGVQSFASPCRVVGTKGDSDGRSITKPAGELSGHRIDSSRPDAPLRDSIAFVLPPGAIRAWSAKVEPCEAFDIDGDGEVGQRDLGIILGAWGTPALAPDLNGDGAVDAADLSLFLGGSAS